MFVEVLGQIGFRASLVFFGSVFSQIVGAIMYATASASEIGFFSYVYARLERDEYRRWIFLRIFNYRQILIEQHSKIWFQLENLIDNFTNSISRLKVYNQDYTLRYKDS